MPAAFAEAETTVVEAVDEAVSSGTDASELGGELFGVVALLDAEPSVRRAMTEPAVDAEAKQKLVGALLHDKVSAGAEQVIGAAVACRWSHSAHLADALDHAGVVAHIVKAEEDGQLENLEDELFRFGRVVEATQSLRNALSDRRAPAEAKRRLVHGLVEGKVTEPTQRLLEHAVSGRGRPMLLQIEEFQQLAAKRRNRLLATVRVAAPMTDEQTDRLAAGLEHQYDHPVHLNVIVDPSVLGGLSVTVGDEVIDSTIANRLSEARRMVAG